MDPFPVDGHDSSRGYARHNVAGHFPAVEKYVVVQGGAGRHTAWCAKGRAARALSSYIRIYSVIYDSG